jgi:hypothetical protein
MKAERLLPSTSVSTWLPNNLPTYLQYETLNFTLSGNLIARGNGTDLVSIFKMSGGFGWDNQAYSSQSFTAPCTIEFNKNSSYVDTTFNYAMIGWNEDPTTNVSYDSIDHASYPYVYPNYHMYNNGAGLGTGLLWSPLNKFYVVYTADGYNKHYNGSTLLYSAAYAANKTVYVDTSFWADSATSGGFTNIRVIKKAWNGTSY